MERETGREGTFIRFIKCEVCNSTIRHGTKYTEYASKCYDCTIREEKLLRENENNEKFIMRWAW